MKRSQLRKVSWENDESVSAIATEAPWDNEKLVVRALAGDPVAENAIYRQHIRYLLNLATRLIRSTRDADEVVQDTYVIAFQKLDRLEHPSAIRQWLTRILLSRIRKRLRVKRLRAFLGFKQIEEDAALQLCAVNGARPDLRAELRELDLVLQKMPMAWRTTWMLHRIEGMSIHEAARATNRSLSTVKRYVAAVDVAVQSNRRPSL